MFVASLASMADSGRGEGCTLEAVTRSLHCNRVITWHIAWPVFLWNSGFFGPAMAFWLKFPLFLRQYRVWLLQLSPFNRPHWAWFLKLRLFSRPYMSCLLRLPVLPHPRGASFRKLHLSLPRYAHVWLYVAQTHHSVAHTSLALFVDFVDFVNLSSWMLIF